jgi:SAM-dependent methyltransferase
MTSLFFAPLIALPTRRNLVERAAEDFRPPIFRPGTSARNRLENWARRFLDLQAGSIWRDLRRELSEADGKLIDIGCGAQVYRGLVPKNVTYCGIDTSAAKARFGYSVPDTRYFEDDDWGVEDGTFDTALCTEVLEHIENPAAFLARVSRCLRPNGRLVMTVPFAARWHFIPFDYWRFTPSGLHQLLIAAGFDEVRVQARGNPLTVACYKIMALNLILLFGSNVSRPGLLKRVFGALLLPMLGVVACIANVSLLVDWGDDCLGYTVLARRKVDRIRQEGMQER